MKSTASHSPSFSRYLIFYSPFDVVYTLCKWFPVKLVLSLLKEVQRVHKVHAGVHHTAKLYPHAYLVQVIIGVVKGPFFNVLIKHYIFFTN